MLGKPILLEALRATIAADGDDPAQASTLVPGEPSELVDRAYLDDQLELLGNARLATFRQLFAETSENLLQQLGAAAAADDRERLRRTVHQLGSAAAALGLAQLFARCSAIEAVALLPSADPAAMVDELATLRRRSLEALDERLRLLKARSE